MFFLYENQGLDFDDVRLAIARFFGSGHRVTIHDGDGCELFERVAGSYCAGTVTDGAGITVATFAIYYVMDESSVSEEASGSEALGHVVSVSFGLPGQWCRNQRDGDVFDRCVDQLAQRYPRNQTALSTSDGELVQH